MQYNLNASRVPPWLRFPYIESGYRLGGTYSDGILSLFKIHNEWLNAWTMIAANVISTVLFLLHVKNTIDPLNEIEQCPNVSIISAIGPFAVLWISALIHLPFSLGYHLFMPISREVFELWRKLDFYMIFASSLLLAISLGTSVDPWWFGWVNAIPIVFIACDAILFSERKYDRSKQTKQVGMAVVFYLIPMIIQTNNEYTSANEIFYAMGAIASLTIGAVAYAFSIPECFSPGTFDLFGNSHHLMHLSILAAHVCEFGFLLERSSK